jgi:hypothetical protein
MAREHNPYSSDATDEEWNFCVPCLALMNEAAPQSMRVHQSA